MQNYLRDFYTKSIISQILTRRNNCGTLLLRNTRVFSTRCVRIVPQLRAYNRVRRIVIPSFPDCINCCTSKIALSRGSQGVSVGGSSIPKKFCRSPLKVGVASECGGKVPKISFRLVAPWILENRSEWLSKKLFLVKFQMESASRVFRYRP